MSNVIGYEKQPDGTVQADPGRLVYRGIDIDTLAAEPTRTTASCLRRSSGCFLFGSLPTAEQTARFRKLLEGHRELPRGFADDMILNSPRPTS